MLHALWGPKHKQDADLLGQVQKRAVRMIRGWTISGLPEAGRAEVVQPGEEKALRETLSHLLVPKLVPSGLKEREWPFYTDR